MNQSIYTPTCKEFLRGIKEFRKREARDPMYKVASFWISHFWGKPREVAEGLGVLLLTWNQAFYRYGRFDFKKLEKFLSRYSKKISSFRERSIENMNKKDDKDIEILFGALMHALKITTGKMKGRKSPVATAKALHLLAPKFFPLWDNRITRAYSCKWKNSDDAASAYIEFCYKTKEIVGKLKKCTKRKDAPILKSVDEYNYARYTKDWV